jgi:class 3 adenylate cyclase
MPDPHQDSATPSPQYVNARYIFLDIVGFTSESVSDQMILLRALNEIVVRSVEEVKPSKEKIIFLPTGDGTCIALTDLEGYGESPHDAHLRLAVVILEAIDKYNQSAKSEKQRRLAVRIGINEHLDFVIIDINGNQNIAGTGINVAERVMSLAGSNQIFVSERVYGTLRYYKEYQGDFHPHEAIVKHGSKMTVYQYVAAGRPGLDTDVRELERSQEGNNLLRASSDCGLKRIYPSRGNDVEVDVLRDVDEARKRVWILAVGLSEKVRFTKLLPTLEQKIGQKIEEIDVKILFLDALRSPALFRTFLEIKPDIFGEILSASRKGIVSDYFQQKLYHSFHENYETLKNNPVFKSAVRFYGHTPVCWLMIIDHTAYFQPYTFGGNYKGDRLLGPWMPVFKFESQEGASTDSYDILKDHFNKLWLTSNADIFQIGTTVQNKDRVLGKIFKDRGDWFRYVYEALYETPGHDQRKYPRRVCVSSAESTIEWGESGKPRQASPKIVNFSREGIRLELKDQSPAKGVIVTFKLGNIDADDENRLALEYLQKELLDPCCSRFRVVWQEDIDGARNIALEAYPQSQSGPITNAQSGPLAPPSSAP